MTNAQPASALREEDLVDAAILGSADAFGELAERHRDKLRRHFLYRTSPDDADDLTQQVFLQAWRSIGRFKRTQSPFVAWLMTIAHNLLVDRARAGGAGRTVSTMRPVHAATWEARDEEDEKHVHPLQLDVIERCLALWSNPGERVLSPFGGVGSEIYAAVKAGRLGVGVELKSSYYRQMVKNLTAIDDDVAAQPTLFDESAG